MITSYFHLIFQLQDLENIIIKAYLITKKIHVVSERIKFYSVFTVFKLTHITRYTIRDAEKSASTSRTVA